MTVWFGIDGAQSLDIPELKQCCLSSSTGAESRRHRLEAMGGSWPRVPCFSVDRETDTKKTRQITMAVAPRGVRSVKAPPKQRLLVFAISLDSRVVWTWKWRRVAPQLIIAPVAVLFMAARRMRGRTPHRAKLQPFHVELPHVGNLPKKQQSRRASFASWRSTAPPTTLQDSADASTDSTK